MLDLLDDILELEEIVTQEPSLYQALHQNEEAVLKVLEKLEKKLSGQESACCLQLALQNYSVEVFQQVLDHSAPGEHAEWCDLTWSCGYGSLLMLAAMLERPRHAQLLLERGYNCNGAGPGLSGHIQGSGTQWNYFVPPYVRYCGSAGSFLRIEKTSMRAMQILCPTPLAAALLCGSLQTAQVLLRWPGVWKQESTAVCRAAVMVLEGWTRNFLTQEQQSNQLEIIRQIFCPEYSTLPERKALLSKVYFQPSSFVDFCDTGTLRCQLESGLCGETDAWQILEIWNKNVWHGRRKKGGKLLLLKKYFPRLCREDWVTGVFLREIIQRIQHEKPYRTLLNAWKQLCGRERDLTWMCSLHRDLDWHEFHQFLVEAKEGGTLVMDADSMLNCRHWSCRNMMELLSLVQFRHRDGEGVNGLVQGLLLSGSLRLLQKAEKFGLLAYEKPKQLLEYLKEHGCIRQDIRAMVLTCAPYKQNEALQMADWKDVRRWEFWCNWGPLNSDEAQSVLHNLLSENLSDENELYMIFRFWQYLKWSVFPMDPTVMVVKDPRYLSLKMYSLAGLACCVKNGKIMELLQKYLPESLMEPVEAEFGEKLFFHGTALTLAAALGRTEQVRFLLESGVTPDEEGRGDLSCFYKIDSSETVFGVTPVLAAILFGEGDTAKLLLESGAVCDFSIEAHRKVLYQGSIATLKLAASLPDVNFESIPRDELDLLEFSVAAGGTQGVFWQNLKVSEPLQVFMEI